MSAPHLFDDRTGNDRQGGQEGLTECPFFPVSLTYLSFPLAGDHSQTLSVFGCLCELTCES